MTIACPVESTNGTSGRLAKNSSTGLPGPRARWQPVVVEDHDAAPLSLGYMKEQQSRTD